jgi:hypothetical protein
MFISAKVVKIMLSQMLKNLSGMPRLAFKWVTNRIWDRPAKEQNMPLRTNTVLNGNWRKYLL